MTLTPTEIATGLTIAGVIAGAIPSYYFYRRAKTADARAEIKAEERYKTILSRFYHRLGLPGVTMKSEYKSESSQEAAWRRVWNSFFKEK